MSECVPLEEILETAIIGVDPTQTQIHSFNCRMVVVDLNMRLLSSRMARTESTKFG